MVISVAHRYLVVSLGLGLVIGIMGCGGRSSVETCGLTALNISPASATADHTLASPGNELRFIAFGVVPPGCVQTLSNLTNVTWSVSDTVNVSISNIQGPTYGTATCNGATSGAVTVTGTAPGISGTTAKGTALLTCK